MGRPSKRSVAIRRGWETRRARIQDKIGKFQERIMSTETKREIESPTLNETQADPVVETVVVSATELHQQAPKIEHEAARLLIKKVNRKRGRPKGSFKRTPDESSRSNSRMDFDSYTSQAFTYEQVRELGVKAIYDGHNFRLLKQNGHVVLAS